MGAWENHVKTQIARKYSPTCPIIKLQKNIYELKDHVGEKSLNLNLPL